MIESIGIVTLYVLCAMIFSYFIILIGSVCCFIPAYKTYKYLNEITDNTMGIIMLVLISIATILFFKLTVDVKELRSGPNGELIFAGLLFLYCVCSVILAVITIRYGVEFVIFIIIKLNSIYDARFLKMQSKMKYLENKKNREKYNDGIKRNKNEKY